MLLFQNYKLISVLPALLLIKRIFELYTSNICIFLTNIFKITKMLVKKYTNIVIVQLKYCFYKTMLSTQYSSWQY